MTLSRWLRDYLYISLGGNRHGLLRNLANLMITMLLGGLWHGAAWTFVFWGFLHGAYLALHRLLLQGYARLGVAAGSTTDRAISLLGWPVTLGLVWITWVFFRAPSFQDAWTITSAMLGLGHAVNPPQVRTYVQLLVWASLLLTVLEPHLERGIASRLAAWARMHYSVRGVAYASLALAVIFFGGTSQKFIYFDF
jgi:D-alanyl-lipoteichoic acid acyltransferase DltB (MBOAT superfamily)